MYCLSFFLHNNYGGKAMNNNSNGENQKNGGDARSAQLEEIKELGSVISSLPLRVKMAGLFKISSK